LYRQLVGALLGRFLFTDAGALEFGHGSQTLTEWASIYKRRFQPSSAKG
jgi:hypothetical protein